MKIGIIGSMQFTDKMLEVKNKLQELHQKYNMDAIREFWNAMQGADAVLVLNYDKNGIPNYVGGNTLMEIGFAHVLNQKIFLLNSIPEMPYCKTEIKAVKPIIIDGDFSKIK